MLLGGLWHGAALHFVIWGAIHGGALAVERLLGFHRLRHRLPRVAWYLFVQATVLVAWVFFRSPDNRSAVAFLDVVISGATAETPSLFWGFALLVPIVFLHVRTWLHERGTLRPPGLAERSVYCAMMFYLCLTAYGRGADFIYFQF